MIQLSEVVKEVKKLKKLSHMFVGGKTVYRSNGFARLRRLQGKNYCPKGRAKR